MLYIRSGTHFQSVSSVPEFIFFMWMSSSSTFVGDTIFAPLYRLCSFVRDHLTTCGSISEISILLTYLSVLSLLPSYLDYFRFIVSLISGGISPPSLFFFFHIISAIYIFLPLHINFRIDLWIFTKELADTLIETASHL